MLRRCFVILPIPAPQSSALSVPSDSEDLRRNLRNLEEPSIYICLRYLGKPSYKWKKKCFDFTSLFSLKLALAKTFRNWHISTRPKIVVDSLPSGKDNILKLSHPAFRWWWVSRTASSPRPCCNAPCPSPRAWWRAPQSPCWVWKNGNYCSARNRHGRKRMKTITERLIFMINYKINILVDKV